MKKYFLKLFQYNAWADERIADCLRRQQVKDEKIVTLMGHIVAAQRIWLHRIKNLPAPDIRLWDHQPLDQVLEMSADVAKQWLELVEATSHFDRELQYKDTRGNPYTGTMEAILIHVVNHGTYHRAQIAMLLREKGFEPVNTDFIIYERLITGQ